MFCKIGGLKMTDDIQITEFCLGCECCIDNKCTYDGECLVKYINSVIRMDGEQNE